MTILTYCSYPVLDQREEPPWVSGLEAVLAANKLNLFSLYHPWVPLKAQTKLYPLLESEPHPFFVENAKLLKLPEHVLRPFGSPEVQKLLSQADRAEPNNIVSFKDLFCLTRSKIVIADLSNPSFGELFQDVFYAHLAEIPLIGVSSRFLLSPVMLNRIETLVPMGRLDIIVQQLVSYSMGYVRAATEKSGDLDTTPEVADPENTGNGNATP